MNVATKTRSAAKSDDIHSLDTIVRRLRVKIESDLRYLDAVGPCSRAFEAIAAGHVTRAAALVVETEGLLDACDRRSHDLSRWYCVRTMAGREVGAIRELSERGFSAFCPMETYVRQAGRVRDDSAQRPLFPGYVFIICREVDFAPILGLDRIQQFVRYQRGDGASRPMPFPLSAIIGMQCEERQGFYNAKATKRAYRPRKGDTARVTGGPWMLYTARILSAPGKKRVRVMMEGPGGKAMDIDIGLLSPA